MPDTVTNELIFETLKKVQDNVADIRNGQTDMRRDMRAMKDEMASMRTIMGEFLKSDARRESDYVHLAARIERIERHLDLDHTTPPKN